MSAVQSTARLNGRKLDRSEEPNSRQKEHSCLVSKHGIFFFFFPLHVHTYRDMYWDASVLISFPHSGVFINPAVTSALCRQQALHGGVRRPRTRTGAGVMWANKGDRARAMPPPPCHTMPRQEGPSSAHQSRAAARLIYSHALICKQTVGLAVALRDLQQGRMNFNNWRWCSDYCHGVGVGSLTAQLRTWLCLPCQGGTCWKLKTQTPERANVAQNVAVGVNVEEVKVYIWYRILLLISRYKKK